MIIKDSDLTDNQSDDEKENLFDCPRLRIDLEATSYDEFIKAAKRHGRRFFGVTDDRLRAFIAEVTVDRWDFVQTKLVEAYRTTATIYLLPEKTDHSQKEDSHDSTPIKPQHNQDEAGDEVSLKDPAYRAHPHL